MVILLLKSSHPRFEILDGRLVLGVDLRPLGICGRNALMSRLGPCAGNRSTCPAVTGSDI
jgi:hypothetical protein